MSVDRRERQPRAESRRRPRGPRVVAQVAPAPARDNAERRRPRAADRRGRGDGRLGGDPPGPHSCRSSAGGIVAYTVLPVVNRLDRVMPRGLAALLTMAGVVGVVALILWAIVPPLAQEIDRLVQALPDFDQADEILDDVEPCRRAARADPGGAAPRGRPGASESSAVLNQYLDRPVRSLVGGLRLLSIPSASSSASWSSPPGSSPS